MELHRRIRERRKEQGLTGLKLARRAGVSPSYISLIEHGEKVPSERVAVRLARALDDREDLYRAWAATARMDERTRRAIFSLDDSIWEGGGLPGSRGWRPSLTCVPLLADDVVPSGRALEQSQIDEHLFFDRHLFGERLGESLVALRIRSEHTRLVASTFRAGDLAIVDRSASTINDGPLLVLRLGGRLEIARARYRDGVLRLLSDSGSEIDFEPAPRSDAEASSLVFGAVVWSLHRWRSGRLRDDS